MTEGIMSAYPTLSSVPIHHTNDPQTSRIAAVDVTASGRRQRQAELVEALLIEHPGLTAGELARLSQQLDRVQVARRLTDLFKLGRVNQGEMRLCSVSGRQCVTWWPRGQGRLL